jgi:hypothetical protein
LAIVVKSSLAARPSDLLVCLWHLRSGVGLGCLWNRDSIRRTSLWHHLKFKLSTCNEWVGVSCQSCLGRLRNANNGFWKLFVLAGLLWDYLLRHLVSNQNWLCQVVCFDGICWVVEEGIALIINVIELLLAKSHTSWITQRLPNRLLSYLLSLIVIIVVYIVCLITCDNNNTVLSVNWWIIITWLCCLGEILGRLVHWWVELILLLLKVSLNRGVLAPCDSCLALWTDLAHLDDSSLLYVIISLVLIKLSLKRIFFLYLRLTLGAHCRTLALLGIFVHWCLWYLDWTSHSFMLKYSRACKRVSSC